MCDCNPQIAHIGAASFMGDLQKLRCFLNTGAISNKLQVANVTKSDCNLDLIIHLPIFMP